MKRKIFFALAALLMLGFVSCSKDKEDDPTLVGTWKITKLMVGEQDMSAMASAVQITFNSDNTGKINMMGQDFSFNWTKNGDNVSVNAGEVSFNCTITRLTKSECTFTSDNLAFPGIGQLPGHATVTLGK